MGDNILGTKIRTARKSKGIKQQEFAQLCGASHQYINYIENGKCLPSLKLIISMALVLGLDLSEELRFLNFSEDEIKEFQITIYERAFTYALNILGLSHEDKNLCVKFYKNISKLSKMEKSFIDNILGSKDA